MPDQELPSPFDDGELYDALFEDYTDDVPFYLRQAREARGRVLDVGCGTGRIMLALCREGIPCDGWDPSPKMIERLHTNAKALGLKVRAECTQPGELSMGSGYALVICAFNAFAHNLTREDQVGMLRRMRDQLADGGKIALHLGHPPFADWGNPPKEPVLEGEFPNKRRGGTLRLYDLRTMDAVHQTQRSVMRIDEVNAEGIVTRSHPSQTELRWIFQNELELLLTVAGYSKWTIDGGFEGEIRASDSQSMVILARR